ncbi:MAG: cupin domain-containing protein [Chloroflexi bacterium]|nr:cupin domain-containing protein [Chloroflexota bacterium]
MHYKENDSTGWIEIPAHHEGEGVFRTWHPFKDVSRLPIKMQLWELEPGASEGSHVHEGERELEELYYFLEGSGTMWSDGDEFPVAAGDAVMAPPGSDHGFRNTGSGPLRLLIIWGKPQG